MNIVCYDLGIGDLIMSSYALTSFCKQTNDQIDFYCKKPDWIEQLVNIPNLKCYPINDNVKKFSRVIDITLNEKSPIEYSRKLHSGADPKILYAQKLGVNPEKTVFNYEIVNRNRMIKEKYVVLSPFTSRKTRNWDIHNWISIIDKLHQKGFKCVVLDAHDGRTRCQPLNCIKYFGLTPHQTANIIHYSDFVISNDSGVAHLSGLIDKTCFVVMAHLDFDAYYSMTNNIVVKPKNYSCSPCRFQSTRGFRAFCDNHCDALNSITSNDVIKEVEKYLKPNRNLKVDNHHDKLESKSDFEKKGITNTCDFTIRDQTIIKLGNLGHKSKGGIYNPSVIEFKGNKWMICRVESEYHIPIFKKVWNPHLFKLDSDNKIIESYPLYYYGFESFNDRFRIEDFRLFEYNGKMKCSHSLVLPDKNSNGYHVVKQAISTIDILYKEMKFESIVDLPVTHNNFEKNYGFFVRNGYLHCLYLIRDWRIFTLIGSEWKQSYYDPNSIKWCTDKFVSNSTHPIRLFNGWVTFIHSRTKEDYYFHGAIYFSDDDLKPISVTDPFLCAERKSGFKPEVMYISSIFDSKNHLELFYGESDSHSKVMYIDKRKFHTFIQNQVYENQRDKNKGSIANIS